MSKIQIFTIAENKLIAEQTYKMTLSGDTKYIIAAGQFVNILIDGLYLRRPISVHDWCAGSMVLIYKVVGRGTKKMAQMAIGQKLDILMGLGNGFDTDVKCDKIAIIGGGVGTPPLYALAKKLKSQGKTVTAVLGFGSAAQVFGVEDFKSVCDTVLVTTVDGSMGQKGFVTDALTTFDYDYYYACGPEPMLRAVHATDKLGELSFEERMGCGFGACMGCSCKTLTGNKRICVEGPVLKSTEVIF